MGDIGHDSFIETMEGSIEVEDCLNDKPHKTNRPRSRVGDTLRFRVKSNIRTLGGWVFGWVLFCVL